ncbi:MAG: DUF6468 domain-containing protein [Elioraea sp.]|nr:DUF6468 domain-containing protein [Elioraea sp.]
MITMAQWALEILLAALLVVTLWYAIRLERRLGVLRRDNAALEQLVAGFNEATARADMAIVRLRGAAEDSGARVAQQIEAAERLRSDLQYLVERAETLADRLDVRVREARGLAQSDHRPPLRAVPDPSEPARVRSQAERDLMQALRLGR